MVVCCLLRAAGGPGKTKPCRRTRQQGLANFLSLARTRLPRHSAAARSTATGSASRSWSKTNRPPDRGQILFACSNLGGSGLRREPTPMKLPQAVTPPFQLDSFTRPPRLPPDDGLETKNPGRSTRARRLPALPLVLVERPFH